MTKPKTKTKDKDTDTDTDKEKDKDQNKDKQQRQGQRQRAKGRVKERHGKRKRVKGFAPFIFRALCRGLNNVRVVEFNLCLRLKGIGKRSEVKQKKRKTKQKTK
jgi:hypothetical protein